MRLHSLCLPIHALLAVYTRPSCCVAREAFCHRRFSELVLVFLYSISTMLIFVCNNCWEMDGHRTMHRCAHHSAPMLRCRSANFPKLLAWCNECRIKNLVRWCGALNNTTPAHHPDIIWYLSGAQPAFCSGGCKGKNFFHSLINLRIKLLLRINIFCDQEY